MGMGFHSQLVNSGRVPLHRANNWSFTVAAGNAFTGGVIRNNRNIQMVTAALNYKFAGWWGEKNSGLDRKASSPPLIVHGLPTSVDFTRRRSSVVSLS